MKYDFLLTYILSAHRTHGRIGLLIQRSLIEVDVPFQSGSRAVMVKKKKEKKKTHIFNIKKRIMYKGGHLTSLRASCRSC